MSVWWMESSDCPVSGHLSVKIKYRNHVETPGGEEKMGRVKESGGRGERRENAVKNIGTFYVHELF